MEKELKRLDIINNISNVLAFLEKAKCVLNDLADKYFGEFYERGTALPHEKQLQLAWEYRKAQTFNIIAFDYVWQASEVLNTLVNELDICPADIKTYGGEDKDIPGANGRMWLKMLRTKKGLSQKETADLLGISQTYYGYIESGERQKDLNMSLIGKISKVFDVSVDYIFEQEKDMA